MSKIDRIISIIRENMVANAPATGGAFGSESPAEGPTAGTSHPMLTPLVGKNKKGKRYIYGGVNSRRNWIQRRTPPH